MKNTTEVTKALNLSVSTAVGADIKPEEQKLADACKAGDVTRVWELVRGGADLDRIFKDSTRVLFSINNGQNKALFALTEAKADVNKRDGRGLTPILTALECGNTIAVEYLTQNGADVELAHPRGDTPLTMACRLYPFSPNHIPILLKAKADPNALSPKGETPIFAVLNIMKEDVSHWGETGLQVIRYLVAAGADPNLPNSAGQTPLSRVISEGWLNVAHTLLELGAEPRQADKKLAARWREEKPEIQKQIAQMFKDAPKIRAKALTDFFAYRDKAGSGIQMCPELPALFSELTLSSGSASSSGPTLSSAPALCSDPAFSSGPDF